MHPTFRIALGIFAAATFVGTGVTQRLQAQPQANATDLVGSAPQPGSQNRFPGRLVTAQAVPTPPSQPEPTSPGSSPVVSDIVARLLAFDQNGDRKLSRNEIRDRRLLRLFQRADRNQDGVVTQAELVAVATQMVAENEGARGAQRNGPEGLGGPGGPDGAFGGPGRFGGPGGPRGRGGPPQPGQILPPFMREQLNLTATQQQQLEALQLEVDRKLAAILTDAQKQQLQQLQRGPGGPGPGGEGGPPPPGGP